MEVEVAFTVNGKVKITTVENKAVLTLEVVADPKAIFRLMNLEKNSQASLICVISSSQASLDFLFPDNQGDTIQILREAAPATQTTSTKQFGAIKSATEVDPQPDSLFPNEPHVITIDGCTGRGETAAAATLAALSLRGAIPPGLKDAMEAADLIDEKYRDKEDVDLTGLETIEQILRLNSFIVTEAAETVAQ